MSKPIALKEIVKGVIQDLTPENQVNRRDIAGAINNILGKKASQHIKIDSYKNNKLRINVDSSVWLYKLTLEKTKLLGKLKTALPRADIEELIFKLGNIKK